jgi:hypothetical protein
LISYTITKPSPKLEVKEAAAGTGALCGSTFLNRRFGEFLASKLSREDGWDEETFAEAMERFDSMVSALELKLSNFNLKRSRSRSNTHRQRTPKVLTESQSPALQTTTKLASSAEGSI